MKLKSAVFVSISLVLGTLMGLAIIELSAKALLQMGFTRFDLYVWMRNDLNSKTSELQSMRFRIPGSVPFGPPRLHEPSHFSMRYYNIFEPPPTNLNIDGVETYGFPPSSSFKNIFRDRLGELPEFETDIATDSYGRRSNEASSEGVPAHQGMDSHKADQHILLIGCSITFGTGLHSHETLAARLERRLENTKTYNAGLPARGPHENYLFAKHAGHWDGIEPKSGEAIFIYHDGLLGRVFSTASWVGSLNPQSFVAQRDSEGQLRLRGKFNVLHPIKAWFYRIWVSSSIFELSAVDLPPITESHFDELARIFVEMRDLYREKTDAKNPFYVVIWPMQTYDHRIRVALEKVQIPFIDYAELHLQLFTQGPSLIPYEGHPSAEYIEIYANLLAGDLARARKLRLGDGASGN